MPEVTFNAAALVASHERNAREAEERAKQAAAVGVVTQNPSTLYPLQDKAPTYPLRK